MKNIVFIIAVISIGGCNAEKKNTGVPDTTITHAVTAVSYRPTFHFAPASAWTNDPNGLVYYKGAYHLFYQCNPFGDKWGHMSWAHATSTDLLNWTHQPVAIPEYKNADNTLTGVFSGTAVVDSFNTSGFGTTSSPMPLIAIYTSNINKLAQHQSLAYSLDGATFTRYANNPILDIHSQEFRDPKVFWHKATNKWVMIISKPDEKKVRFYSSANLKEWQYMSDFGATGNTERIWECPDMFELPVDNTTERKWVITNSSGHPQNGYLAMQYFIGNFDGTTFTKDHLNYPLYLDYGKDFYAGIIYNNLPSNDSRKIMIGWANCWEYANDIPTTGFRGMMAVPRDLHLKKTSNGQYILTQMPITETDNYKGPALYETDNLSLNNSTDNGNAAKGDALDIEFSLTRGDAEQAGIKVFKNANEETVIYYDKADNKIKIDRTKSGNTSFSSRFPSVESVLVGAGNSDIKLRILMDKSLVEVFINDGEQVMTDQVFPSKNGGAVEFFSVRGKADFKTVKIYKMNPSMN